MNYSSASNDDSDDSVVRQLFEKRYEAVARRTDTIFAGLMILQWLAGIFVAVWLSPRAWAGARSSVHEHVLAAVLLGGAITSLPLALIIVRPGQPVTRYVIASAQAMWSALLIHLSGGRIETHFHVFGSLAIIAFYRDPRVLIPATALVAIDHFVRGMVWPESVYGVVNPEWWRFLEHAGWVVFIDTFLVINCVQSRRELFELCRQHVDLEDAQEQALRVERLAAVGQLAASIGHELRNPLAAIRNAQSFVKRKLTKDGVEISPRVEQFFGVMEREIDASTKIISDLLDFARAREPKQQPTPLRDLADEALGVIPDPPSSVVVLNEIPDDLDVPELDRDQMRQVLINLVQNAVEAMPEKHSGEVRVTADFPTPESVRVCVIDNGPGMPEEVLRKVFQPLFSTKTKGTGLGLAVVQGVVERHGGTVSIESAIGEGTKFSLLLPALAREPAGISLRPSRTSTLRPPADE